MPLPRSSLTGPWRLRGRPQLYEVTLGSRPRDDATAAPVPPEFMCWHLDHWLTCAARSSLLEMYTALGGAAPWALTSLERTRHDGRVRERLSRAFALGELVAFTVEERVGAWSWPEPAEPLRPEPPAPQPVPEEELFPNIELQVQALKRAAEQGVPFCEECARRKLQREQREREAA